MVNHAFLFCFAFCEFVSPISATVKREKNSITGKAIHPVMAQSSERAYNVINVLETYPTREHTDGMSKHLFTLT